MNYPRLFERCYLRPVAITRPAFRSIHHVMRPRILGLPVTPVEQGKKKLKSSTGRQDYPAPTRDADGDIIDDRLYSIVGPGVATIGIKGILARNVSALEAWCGFVGYEAITAAARQLQDAWDITDVILDIDSPGGECAGVQESYDALRELSKVKRVVTFTDGMACSAGYELACAGTDVYCTATAQLGSIGVICGVLDDTQYLLDQGFKMEWFTAGEHKAVGREGYVLTDSDRDVLQAEVDYLYSMFADSVRATRGNIVPLVQKTAEVYWGQRAVGNGLADAVVPGFDEVVSMLLAPVV
jgi:signal peptide peptidase SppA